MTSTPVLSVEELRTQFATPEGTVHAVSGVSFTVCAGEVLGVVGESGSGKSVTMLSVLQLVDSKPGVVSGDIRFQGERLVGLSGEELRRVRGNGIGMIFQDPMTTLNPVFTVGYHLVEAVRTHNKNMRREEAEQRAVELLRLVDISEPQTRLRQYPHEFSGGMRQRVVIAMAIANRPALIIADEPTTALDVTVQAQILELFRDIRVETGAAVVFITHDLGVVAEIADRVAVMYAGRIVELGDVMEIFTRPRHPYTVGLMRSLPRLGSETKRLEPIDGQPPNLLSEPIGCPFVERCWLGKDRAICSTETPHLEGDATGHAAACHFSEEVTQAS